MAYGLLTTGFAPKTLAVILAEIDAEQRASAALATDFDASAESVLGQLNGIVAAKLTELWELGEAVYNARNPRGASYSTLDNTAALTGVTRLPATKGTTTLSVTLNAGVTLPVGSIAHVAGQPGNRWVTTSVGTNPGGSPATVQAYAEAETAGRYIANAGTITTIAVPVSGWTAVTNASDAMYGRSLESDTALRARRERVIRAGGSSPLDAVRAALFAVPGVTQVTATENGTSAVSGGMEPHSITAIVTGGTDQDVGNALWAAKGGGIYTNGNTPVNVVDDGGRTHTVRFNRPTTINVYIGVTIERDVATYEGDDAVKAAIVAIGEDFVGGTNVRLSAVTRAVLAVPGVVDVTRVVIGRASGASMVASNLLISTSEIADLDAGRITVTVGDVTA